MGVLDIASVVSKILFLNLRVFKNCFEFLRTFNPNQSGMYFFNKVLELVNAGVTQPRKLLKELEKKSY